MFPDLDPLLTLGLAILMAFLVSYGMTPPVKGFAEKIGAMDIPKDDRRVHDHPIPRMGGLAIILGFMLAVLFLGGYWKAETPMDRARILCDGFSVPGAMLMLTAGVLFASGQGAFNGVLFGLKRTKEILLPFLPSEYVPYREFIKRRAEKKKSGYGKKKRKKNVKKERKRIEKSEKMS